MPTSVYLIDDHPLVRAGLAAVLGQAGYIIGGTADDVAKALLDPALSACAVVVLDLALGEGDSTALIPSLVAPNRGVLVCSMYEDAPRVRKVFGAGATGYVTKGETAQCLLQAVAEVSAGRRYFSPRVEAALLADKPHDHSTLNWHHLTDREREVVCMLADGAGAEVIARYLSISPRTVEAYYARIAARLAIQGVKELRRLAILAARSGQLSPTAGRNAAPDTIDDPIRRPPSPTGHGT